ncbi:probable sodium/potassium/calcium exchanger CG1090 [Scaptodrosophila lebanonensis]|uniref:Probable sodium/potassium/calcium exchanger CG1090 n=1 Tax=Drosophila lebanonensis TaxID=7225 RepID=A0A6J2UGA0_DROLE|nr:probable sodium/potassium/calcium exchanger CG1090 [Scaptodrosophila lebanonensis]
MYLERDEDLQNFLRDNGFDSIDLRSDLELNCSVPDILEFPNLFRKKSIFNLVFCGVTCLYLFIFLAIVCDDYLVTSMERLSYALRMTYDIAGATFMAASTSAPELFVNFVGTFVTEGDIGVGTIVGSSVFNILAICAVCGLCTGVTSKLDWWPITRDIAWYLISIVVLCVVLLDSLVTVYESVILCVGYILYMICLLFDIKIQRLFREVDHEAERITENPMDREEEPLKSFKDHVLTPPEGGCCAWVWWIIKYPSLLVLALTVPSVRTIYLLTMIVSVVWISVVSYILTWFLTVVGYNIGIPDSIMGLTILAAGTSVPEAVSSYIVTKKGYGAMAVCNAVGSNTFDIFICLGLPWLLKHLILRRSVEINSSGLAITSAMLLITGILLFVSFLVTKWTMGKLVGFICLIAYLIFLVISCALEIYLLKPTCDIESAEYEYLAKNK